MEDFSVSQERLGELVERALAELVRAGADSGCCEAGESVGLTVTVRGGALESVEQARRRDFSVTAYVGERTGAASTTLLTEPSVCQAARQAVSIARFSAPDPCAGLPDAAWLCTDPRPVSLFYPTDRPVQDFIADAGRAEEAALAVPGVCACDGATVELESDHFRIGSTDGFRGGYPSTRYGLSVCAIAQDAGGLQQSFWESASRDAARLMDAAELGAKAGRRTAARAGARTIGTCNLPVLFEAPVACTLLSCLAQAVSGGALFRKASFLANRFGDRVLPRGFSVREDPFADAAENSAPFDSEGVAGSERLLVDDGVLEGRLLGTYSARRLGLVPTGNADGPYNLTLAADRPEGDFDAMLEALGTGLLVTDMIGSGIDIVTGDFSQGASGFWVERGQIAFPVDGITLAGNLADMLGGLLAQGSDVHSAAGLASGSLLVSSMTAAGQG